MNAWTVHMSFEFVVLRMLKFLALERMMKKENCYWGSEKSSNWFLKQEKAVKKKRKISKKKKEKERNKVVIQGKKSVLKNPGHLWLGTLAKRSHNLKRFTQSCVCGMYVSGGNTGRQSALGHSQDSENSYVQESSYLTRRINNTIWVLSSYRCQSFWTSKDRVRCQICSEAKSY